MQSIATAFVFATVACDSPTVSTGRVPTVTITPPNAVLGVGDTVTFNTEGDGRAPCVCRWSSSRPELVTISAVGLIRALAPGQTTVTATLVRDPDARASALVTIRSP